jgi:hypothetical protein
MSQVDLRFPYPTTVAWLGLLTTTACSAAALRFTSIGAARQRGGGSSGSTAGGGTAGALSGLAAQRVSMSTRHYLTHVLPTGFCMALTFQTGKCLKHTSTASTGS